MSDTPVLIPSVDEVLERAEQKKQERRISKDELRMLNPDNTWNKEGILSAFDESEDTMVYCAASGVPLYYIDRNGREWTLESYGYCAINGRPYHREYLHMADDVIKMPYPVVYEGRISIEEWKKPLTEAEEIEIRKMYGV